MSGLKARTYLRNKGNDEKQIPFGNDNKKAKANAGILATPE